MGKVNHPSMDEWIREAKKSENADKIGMYLFHNGVVRKTSKAKVRYNDKSSEDVKNMEFSYDEDKVKKFVEQTYELPGVYYARVWLNSGILNVGDDIMYVLVGGDIRPHTIDALQFLVGKIKTECVGEHEITA